tara:strand:+ start:93 stop:344 length:252 start_codon:yes stop_codon:yes gene_type:complete
MPDGSIGTPIKRREDHRFLTGAGRYVDDFDRPGRIHVSMVRSPVGHAKIPNVDTSKAEAGPGVVKSLKGADWAADEVGALSGG